tara:strand:+ start:381 stop:902 length:522 start_codon:yes stop_codon:yes gene_type:complete
MTDSDIELDISWVKEYEEKDNIKKIFYKNKVNKINIHTLYINTNNEIDKSYREKIELKKNNVLSKEELIFLIKDKIEPSNTSNKISLSKAKYKLLSILLYNNTLEPHNILEIDDTNYLKSINYLNDIDIEDTITFFNKLNTIYIILYENQPSKNNKTKRVKITQKKNTRRTRP